ncbi:hypothetical protein BN1708_011712, partial [Verticillium longisporum]
VAAGTSPLDPRPSPSINVAATMLYELIGIVRPGHLAEVKEIALTAGQTILRSGGVVRGLANWGVFALPRPITRAQMKHKEGHYFVGRGRAPVLLLPLDVLAEAGVREEDVFRRGPEAAGFEDAVFAVATRANDHLITAREMLKNLRLGKEAGHAFEHEGEEGHVYAAGESDAARDIRQSFSVLMEAVPPQAYLTNLEKANFNPFAASPLNLTSGPSPSPSINVAATMLYELIGIVRPGHLAEVKEYALIPAMTDAFPPISLEPAALELLLLPLLTCHQMNVQRAGVQRADVQEASSEQTCSRRPASRRAAGVQRADVQQASSEQHSKQSSKLTSPRIALTAGQTILRSGGVVRGLANWGVFALPRPITRAQMKHKEGHYFVMRYDASARAHQTMRSTISLDPRVIRSAHVKVGDGKLSSMARFGAIKWDVRDE